jgi:hypothetical protein
MLEARHDDCGRDANDHGRCLERVAHPSATLAPARLWEQRIRSRVRRARRSHRLIDK